MSPDQFDRLKRELAEDHAGPTNAGRPMLLEGGLDWQPMALSPANSLYCARIACVYCPDRVAGRRAGNMWSMAGNASSSGIR